MDRARGCVCAQFKAFANSVEFRQGTERILDAIKQSHATALVSDNRRLEGVSTHDQLWIRDTWVPLAVEAGLTRIAVVVAHFGLGKIASEEILTRIGDGKFESHTFDSVEEALKWVALDSGR